MNQLRRLANVAAFTFIVSGFALPNAYGEPVVLATPSGLNPGDKFRFIFVTDGVTPATSSDISTYNLFVQSDAAGATYNGVTVNWKAIGSTPTVNARDNVGGFGTSVPVYLPSGLQVATGLGSTGNNLWSATQTPNLLNAPNQLISGAAADRERVWTGTSPDGAQAVPLQLGGGFGQSIYGTSSSTVDGWIASDFKFSTNDGSMYGLSEELTVPVPEPGSCALALACLACGGFAMWRRRKRA